MNRSLIRTAMIGAGVMLAHQVAAKAFRDATFLTAFPAAALPLMTIATAALTGLLAPVVSRSLDRYAAAAVVTFGFGLSVAAHLVEWEFYNSSRWVAVAIYLHLAGVTALLLSGFWSLIAERFDPASARSAYGRISAAGTIGGIAGSLAAERMATLLTPRSVLLLLAALHLSCVASVLMMRRAQAMLPVAGADSVEPGAGAPFTLPYVRNIAMFVVLTSASTAIIDFLMKSHARASFGSGPELLRFFASFYGAIQLLSFLAQTQSATVLQRLGVRVLNVLPGSVGTAGTLALMITGWPAVAALRGIDAIVRNSLFRGGYELLFVPMDARTRNRVKPVLDVICDRVGEAAGSGVVQVVLLAGLASTANLLLGAAIVVAAVAFRIGRRFEPLYVDVIERQLVKYGDTPHLSLVSEQGWTLLQVPGDRRVHPAEAPHAPGESPGAPILDGQLQLLADLRSHDAQRVTAALSRGRPLGRIPVAEAIELLAWDEVLPATREALQDAAPAHSGMLIDALLNPSTDFVIRRRLPRILSEVASERSFNGLIDGLGDMRFEVRYHCSRALARLLASNPRLSIDHVRVIGVIERELSVPAQKWRGYRLIDRPDSEPEPAGLREFPDDTSRFLEYVFYLLSTIVPREPLGAAVHGVSSPNAGIRGLAVEYLDQMLPPAVLGRVRELLLQT